MLEARGSHSGGSVAHGFWVVRKLASELLGGGCGGGRRHRVVVCSFRGLGGCGLRVAVMRRLLRSLRLRVIVRGGFDHHVAGGVEPLGRVGRGDRGPVVDRAGAGPRRVYGAG